jgi:hypothetical protein
VQISIQSYVIFFFQIQHKIYSMLQKMILFYTHEKNSIRYLSISTHAGRPKLKMVTNCFRTIIFMWPMRRLNMHLGGHNFCLLGFGRVGKGVLFFLFPMCSHQVSKGVPKIPPHFYPIYYGKSWAFIYKTIKVGWREPHTCFYFGQCPMFQKNWWWANKSGSFQLKKKLWVHTQLIN